MPPAVLPRNKVVGTSLCIASGEEIANRLTPAEQDDGFPLNCYVPDVPRDPEWHRVASIWRCPDQKFYAQLLQLLYEDLPGPALFAARAWFGGAVTLNYHAGTTLLPTVLTVVGPEYYAVFATGTNNYQQLALQAFMSIRGPRNIGAYSTNPQWYIASQWVHDFLIADGATGALPMLFCGHSYGAAAVLNLAARYRFANDVRQIRYITYGCPKVGDRRFVDLLKACEGIDFTNTGDFVTVLPPGPIILNPVYVQLMQPALLFWTEWEFPPNLLLQFPDGSIQINNPPTLDSFTLLGYSVRALLDIQLDQILTHNLQVYIERIALRCPGGEFPAGGSVGLGAAAIAAGQLGLRRAESKALGQLGLGAAAIAAGQVGIAFNGLRGSQLGLGAAAIAAGQLSLGAAAIAAGQVGIAFNGLRGSQLGLGAAAIAAGQLGLVGGELPAGQLGLVGIELPAGRLGLFVPIDIAAGQLGLGSSADIAAGALALGFSGIPGQLGLVGAGELPAGQLGLGSSADIAAGALALGFSGIPGQLGLVGAGELPAGRLGLVGVELPAGQLGLFMSISAGALELGFSGIPGQLGLFVPIDIAAGQLGLGTAQVAAIAAGQLGLGAVALTTYGSIGFIQPAPLDYVLDTFTDSSGTALTSHTPEIGGPWVALAGTMQIQSNAVQGITYGPFDSACTIQTGHTDYDLRLSYKVAAGTSTTQDFFATLVRTQDLGNTVYCYYYGTGLLIQSFVGGSLVDDIFLAHTLTQGVTYDVLIKVRYAAGVEFFIDGVSLNMTTTTLRNNTLVGIDIIQLSGINHGSEVFNIRVSPP
jgi:hypothetical protein